MQGGRALLRGKIRARRVSLRGCAATRELAIIVEPGRENLDLGVRHRSVGADELFDRRADLIPELTR